MLILLLLISQQMDISKTQSSDPGLKCKELIQAGIVFLSLLIYSGVCSFSLVQLNRDVPYILCHHGDKLCYDSCMSKDTMDDTCMKYFEDYKYQHSNDEVSNLCSK
jgi:hypothetical protein